MPLSGWRIAPYCFRIDADPLLPEGYVSVCMAANQLSKVPGQGMCDLTMFV